MTTKKSSASSKLEGEGSYSATRAYNAKLRNFERSADVGSLAESARRALGTREGAELKKAEARAKRGPTAGKPRRPAKPARHAR